MVPRQPIGIRWLLFLRPTIRRIQAVHHLLPMIHFVLVSVRAVEQSNRILPYDSARLVDNLAIDIKPKLTFIVAQSEIYT